MIFVEEIFRFMQFEETLLFTSLDVDFNSRDTEANEVDLVEMTEKNLSEAFTCDRLSEPKSPLKPLSLNELKTQISRLKHDSSVWRELKDILLAQDDAAVDQ
jgi:hypothetical protein